ncbi:MAG: hypothetical protein SLAVMIC_00144 [uncultured marine phage]|uniref:Putative phage metallopeptidase domain-containing protein n=1 Tax=uncultured marine phage TaxID=707152 RepID=A0A8D9CB33_9VIRU|nr:MAG: hypothetical protein SLAVMIC_00144 [uncultured marine phage]
MDKFYELSEDVIATFREIYNKKSFPVEVKFKFMGYTKQKTLIQLSKPSEKYQFAMGAELVVSINEDLYDKFEEDISIEILFSQEIDKITMNMESGKITLVKPDLTTFSGIVNKYGIEEVARANQVEDLTVSQKEDQETEFLA